MTKRCASRIPLILVLVLLVCPAAGYGEDGETYMDTHVTLPIDYEGAWLTMQDYGFQVFLPLGWVAGPSSEADGVALVDPDTERTMWIEMVAVDGFTLDDVLAVFQDAENLVDVSILHFGEVPFITYNAPQSDMLGAATLSADQTKAFFFKFMPYSDADYRTLALKIMSTLTPAL